MLFPDKAYESCRDYAVDYFDRIATAMSSIDMDALDRAATALDDLIANGGTVYTCGNGGSAAIANHLTCDCLKGIRGDTDIRPNVHSLSTTIELITAIANDLSYDKIFSYQLESHGRPGDLLIAISSSGNSPNIVEVLNTAKEIGMRSIAMTGFSGGQAAEIADINLWVQAENYGIVEDVHQGLMHLLAQFIRQKHMADRSLIGRRKF